MTYQAGIPLPGDKLNKSQNDIKNNFTSCDGSFNLNHFGFSTLGGQAGKHKFVEMPVQTKPSIVGGEGALYTKTSGQTQLFYTSDNSTPQEYQMTRVIDASIARFANNPGWTFLPGGLILQWGFVAPPGTSGTVTFLPNGVNFTVSIMHVFLTLERAGTANESTTYNNASLTGFNYLTTSSGGSTTLHWIAIGI